MQSLLPEVIERTTRDAALGVNPATPRTRRLREREGSSVEIRDDVDGTLLRVCDRRGEMVFEFRPDTGGAVLRVPAGGLAVEVPRGDIDFEAGGDIRWRAGGDLRMSARSTTIVAERLEVVVRLLVERVRDAFRAVSDLLHVRAGRMHTRVQDSYRVQAESMCLAARDKARVHADSIELG